jgi:hypothetical protein
MKREIQRNTQCYVLMLITQAQRPDRTGPPRLLRYTEAAAAVDTVGGLCCTGGVIGGSA